MKKVFIPVLIALGFLLSAGCSEKFNTAAPYKDITVVWGFLDASDTAHYIRIQKAFLDNNKSAITMAQSPDSSFYANLNVKIERLSYTDTTHVYDTIHLTRVDLNQEGYPKQPGQFFTAPNYAYKFKGALNKDYIYRLIITNLSTGVVDSAEAPVIDDTNPTAFYVDALDSSLQESLDFASTGINKYFEIQASYNPFNTNFSFEQIGNPVVMGQVVIRFNWVDSDGVSHQKQAHSYDYNAGYVNSQTASGSTTGSFDVKLYNTTLYSAVAAAMDPAPSATIYRLLDRCNLYFYMGTADFNTYLQTSLTQGTGLTGTEIEPVYTNVKGPNAVGLFTSRGVRSGLITLTPFTVDSLMVNPLTKSANIAGTVY